MKKTSLSGLLGLAAAFLFANSIDLHAIEWQRAQTKSEKPLHFFLGCDLTFGGDKLATIYLTSGAKENIRAGYIAEIKGGADYLIIPNVSLRGSIGIHFDQESAGSDGDLNFVRFPVEGIVFFHTNKKLNVGVGVRKALGATLKGTKKVANYIDSYNLDSSVGIVFEAEYKVVSWGFFLRYVSEKYRLNSYSSWSHGGHVGVGANYYFK